MDTNVTIMGNGGEYSDWDVKAVVFADELTVQKLMKDHFRQVCPNRLALPTNKRLTIHLCWGKTFDEMIKKSYIRSAVYDGRMLDESCFLPISDDDVAENYMLVDRDGFLEFLKKSGIKFITEFGKIG